MNKCLRSVICCVGACGILTLSAFPVFSANADVITEYPPPLEEFDPTEDYGFIALGRAVTSMYSYTVEEGCLTFNTSDIYGFTDPLNQYVVSHRLDLYSYCMEYPYLGSSADYYQSYVWDEGWFDAGDVYLKYQFYNEYLPCADDSIGNVYFAFSNADVLWKAHLYGSIFDIGSKTYKTFDFTTASLPDSFAYLVDMCAVETGSVDGYGFWGYQFFESLTIEFIPVHTEIDTNHAIFVYTDGYGTGYSNYISDCDLFRRNFFSGTSVSDPDNALAYAVNVVRGFLSTEFLPNFTFGNLLLICLGGLMLGLGLKIALGG